MTEARELRGDGVTLILLRADGRVNAQIGHRLDDTARRIRSQLDRGNQIPVVVVAPRAVDKNKESTVGLNEYVIHPDLTAQFEKLFSRLLR